MSRIVTTLMSGWEFTLMDPENQNFKPINLPHDWAIYAPINKSMRQGEAQGFRDRWGIGWYRRTLQIDKLKSNRIYQLQFDGIYENSTIWINGKEAGSQKYGYSSFSLDITELLHVGDNEILVKVDNTSFPADRWYSGAGIYRTVKLLELDKYHLNPTEVQVKTTLAGKNAVIKVDTGFTGTNAMVKAIVSDKNLTLSKESEGGIITLEIPDAKLWSPEAPNLYNLELSLSINGEVLDSIYMKIGVREIIMDANKGMMLNGKVTKIKGLCIHQDAGCLGVAVPAEIWRDRLIKFKEIGCNAVRTAHHIFAPEFLDICDELGLLVYEEPFDKWVSGSYLRYFETEWKHDLESMVKRDRNHPCIFMWGVGNEVENQAHTSMLYILKMLKSHLLTMDDTRAVSYAMNPHFKYQSEIDYSKVEDIQKIVDEADDTEIYDVYERIERIRRIGEIVDVVCCNYQEQWYEEIRKVLPDKLILGTETYQYFRGHMDHMQNFSNEVPWMDVEKHDYVIGGMLWTGIDYLGESMGYPAKGWAGSLFWTNSERKPLSYLYQSYWTDEPMIYFAAMDYSLQDELVKEHWDAPRYASHWDFPQYNKTVIPFMIATNCEEVEIEINEKQFYGGKPADFPSRMITGFLPYLKGTLTVKGYINKKEVCRHVVKTTGPAVRLKFDTDTITLDAKEGFHKLFTVRPYDTEGNLVFRESAKVTFRVDGPAEIIGVDNGDLCSSESYHENFMHLYRGFVSTVIRLTGEKGRVVLTAWADGMYEARLVINVV